MAPAASGEDAAPAAPGARQENLRRTGGGAWLPAQGPVIKFVSCQSAVAFPAVTNAAAEMARMTRLPVVAQDMGGGRRRDARALIGRLLGDAGTAAVVVLCDAAGEPPLLVAPESRWAVVSVAALAADKPSAEVLAARVRKEQWRAFAYVMGAANSNIEHCLMKPVFSTGDLDALRPLTISPEPVNKITQQAARLGISPARVTSYRRACEEGWAPAPTNDIQRAVWDEVKGKGE